MNDDQGDDDDGFTQLFCDSVDVWCLWEPLHYVLRAGLE